MVSIREVARLAQVSPATVSRVMNETARVDKEKADRVWKVIHETGFIPNEIARSLYKKSSRIVGLIVPDIENPFFNQMAKVIEEEAYRNGYRVILCNTGENKEREKDNIQMLTRMNADGIILMTANEKLQTDIEMCKIPVIVLDRQITGAQKIVSIQADHYEGGKIATEYLIRCGCRNIVNIKGPQMYSSGRARYKGYQDICRKYNRKEQCMECDYSFQKGLRTAEKILERYPDVDGIIACNDMVAISIYKIFTKAGIKIPDQVQLIGFDNIELSSLMTPELTTIAQPIGEMGKQAIQMIIQEDILRGKKKEYTFPVTLIPRETTIMHI